VCCYRNCAENGIVLLCLNIKFTADSNDTPQLSLNTSGGKGHDSFSTFGKNGRDDIEFFFISVTETQYYRLKQL
jgi:hypothetical protein